MNANNILAIGSIVITELYRRKDFYVLFILTVLITALAGSANFFNDARIVGWLKELSLTLIWLASLVIAINTAARQIPAERESRTIFPLLAKPVTRADVMVGKFLGCWLACGLALVVFYAFFGIVVSTKGGSVAFADYVMAFWLHWMMLAMVIALSLLGSLLFTSVAANVTICFVIVVGILFVGFHLGKVAQQQTEPVQSILLVLYNVVPQFGFFDTRQKLIHGSHLALVPVLLANLYAWAYAAVFLVGGWLAFRRKALN
jgi:Cu-processing system permease protein